MIFTTTSIFNKKNTFIFFIIFSIVGGLFFRGFILSKSFLPKPKGYIRIKLPKHEYIPLKDRYPYFFEHSKHAKIIPVSSAESKDKYFIDIFYPKFNASIHITHRFLYGNKKLMRSHWAEASRIISKHQIKASEIRETAIINKYNVKIIFTEIFGEHIASQCQFYATDYKNSFIMASLYFNLPPNQEYLRPMIDFIKKDIKHIIKTFRWK